MAEKVTRLTHKIAIQLCLLAELSVPFAVLAPGGQSGYFPRNFATNFPYEFNCYAAVTVRCCTVACFSSWQL